jgi:hypothetical protein
MILKKIYKLIPAFFLWIAGLTVCAHLMIPHDHHPADSSLSQKESCPASNNHTGHHTGFPIHCHAFNDIASEKATVFVITDILHSPELPSKSYKDAFVFDLNASRVNYSNIREPIPDHYLLELSPFRAPPELS